MLPYIAYMDPMGYNIGIYNGFIYGFYGYLLGFIIFIMGFFYIGFIYGILLGIIG